MIGEKEFARNRNLFEGKDAKENLHKIDMLIKSSDVEHTLYGDCGNFAYAVSSRIPSIDVYGFLSTDLFDKPYISHYVLRYKDIAFDGSGAVEFQKAYNLGSWDGQIKKLNKKTGREDGKSKEHYEEGMIYNDTKDTKVLTFIEKLRKIVD